MDEAAGFTIHCATQKRTVLNLDAFLESGMLLSACASLEDSLLRYRACRSGVATASDAA